MRFEKTRKSGTDEDIDVYTFTFGSQEIRCILGILEKEYRNIPNFFEFNPQKNRIKNITKCLNDVCMKYNLKLPRQKDEKSIN